MSTTRQHGRQWRRGQRPWRKPFAGEGEAARWLQKCGGCQKRGRRQTKSARVLRKRIERERNTCEEGSKAGAVNRRPPGHPSPGPGHPSLPGSVLLQRARGRAARFAQFGVAAESGCRPGASPPEPTSQGQHSCLGHVRLARTLCLHVQWVRGGGRNPHVGIAALGSKQAASCHEGLRPIPSHTLSHCLTICHTFLHSLTLSNTL